MKRETDRLRVFTMLALAAALFTLFRTFPLSGDDWFREGLGASLHSIGDLACVVAEKWRTTNGRILGNILAYSAGSRPILRDLLRALITLVLIALLARVSKLTSTAGLLLCAAAVFTLPRELFREAYPEVTPLLVCTAQLIPTRHSRLFDCRIIAGFEREEVFPDALLGVLRECSKDYEKLLVIPCSDYYTGLLCRHYDHFEGLIANRFIPEQLLETFDTKDRFYALCEQYGMDYPKTVIAASDERIEVADRLPFDFPIVVKPENSNALDYLRCHFEGQKKVFFFDTREEYLTMVRSMNGSDYRGKLILQEFIPGGDDAMRVLNSYSDTDGTVRAMCLGQPVLEYYDPKSAGNYAAILSRGDTLLYDKMQRFLQAIGYVGFSNIDMKYDSRTGRYVLFEINPRLGRSSFFCRAAGINMMKLLTEDVVYGRRGKCIYNETTALWSNVPRGILTRYVTSPALREEMKQYKALHTLWCGGDLAPVRVYRLARYYAAQYKNFAHYYFDKSKEK